MDFHIVKMYKDKEVNKNVKNILLSMCDVSVFDIYGILLHIFGKVMILKLKSSRLS
jgi:hypothetical protein